MHLTAEMFNQMAGTKLALVPYRGMAPVVTDLIGSHVAFGIIDPPSGMSAIEGGQDQAGRGHLDQAHAPSARHSDRRRIGRAGLRV